MSSTENDHAAETSLLDVHRAEFALILDQLKPEGKLKLTKDLT